MGNIIDLYGTLPPALKFYWALAAASSLVFLIQMALTLIGVGDTDTDASMDTPLGDGNGDTLDTGGAFQLFSVRNIVNFLLGVGWGGVCFWGAFDNHHLVTPVAFMCGLAFVVAFLYMARFLMRFQRSGNFYMQDCVGMACSVYLRIPASRLGCGKVQLSRGGSVLEIDALTDGPLLPTGTKVRVVSVVDSHTLLVEVL